MSAPFAARPLFPIPAFIPIYESAIVVTDLVTAALLFGQLLYFRSKALLILASGYLFTALLAIAHALTFPGLFTSTGLLGAGPQTTAWLYMFWHGGFPLFVVAYTLLRGEFGGADLILWCITAAVSAAAFAVLMATQWQGALPSIMSGHGYTSLMVFVVGAVCALSAAAVVALWRRKPRTVLDAWLMAVMAAWVFDIALSAVLNAGRFDLGFYVGRIYGLVAATLVLVVLLFENGKLYRKLREESEALDRARQAALDAERAKGAFLATMSHEIRTPMGGVLGMLELLSLTKLDAEQRTMLGVVRESGHSLMRIIDDILNFSKLEAGKLDLRPEPILIADAVERARNTYSGTASGKGIALTSSTDPQLDLPLMVDPTRLGQILNNLVSNALKFTVAGEVSIRAQRVARLGSIDIVRITVNDSGVGIGPDEAAGLFQPFAQAGGRSAPGTGLGLSISRRIALLMQGTLTLESEVGVGTRMFLTLPLEHASARTGAAAQGRLPEAPRQVRAPTLEEARASGSLILVLDDHPINRLVLAKQLGSIGYAADAASSGSEALAKLAQGGFGAAITDCHMPQMSGYEFARQVRALERSDSRARMPIIACTASAMEDEAARCHDAGMDAFLTKPVDLQRLQDTLGRWVAVNQGPINPAVLDELVGGDPRAGRELMAQFLSYNREDVRDLKNALTSADSEGIARAAHRIKGSSRAVGATALGDVCENLEVAARGADLARVQVMYTSFERELGRVESHISSMEQDP